MSKIITLSGKQFCGKDYTARLLLESLPSFCRIGLADDNKLEYSKQTGLSVEEIEKNKSTYRPDLIALGNKGRAISPDYWINNILEKDANVIVPDVRLPHEVEKFKENQYKRVYSTFNIYGFIHILYDYSKNLSRNYTYVNVSFNSNKFNVLHNRKPRC